MIKVKVTSLFTLKKLTTVYTMPDNWEFSHIL